MANSNVKLILSYDGTDYCGFQSQTNGNTIEDNLKKAISQITSSKISIYCAGRTDSGVHAEGQVVNFYTDKKNMSEKNWVNALNSILPMNIRILKAEFVDDNFHARRSALYREYWYKITNAPVISALNNRYSILYKYPLNIELLQEYCNILVGEHDFTSFCALSDMSKSKVRYIHSINIERNGFIIYIKIIGNAFLQHMIRTILGTILKLHRFEMPCSEMKKILEGKNRRLAGPTFAAKGLTFQTVYYTQLKG